MNLALESDVEKISPTRSSLRPSAHLLVLSDEILIMVLKHLNIQDRISVGQSCKRLRMLVSDKVVCRNLDFQGCNKLKGTSACKYLSNKSCRKYGTSLDASGCYWLHNKLFYDKIKQLANISTLDLKNIKIEALCLMDLLMHLPQVKCLSLSWWCSHSSTDEMMSRKLNLLYMTDLSLSIHKDFSCLFYLMHFFLPHLTLLKKLHIQFQENIVDLGTRHYHCIHGHTKRLDFTFLKEFVLLAPLRPVNPTYKLSSDCVGNIFMNLINSVYFGNGLETFKVQADITSLTEFIMEKASFLNSPNLKSLCIPIENDMLSTICNQICSPSLQDLEFIGTGNRLVDNEFSCGNLCIGSQNLQSFGMTVEHPELQGFRAFTKAHSVLTKLKLHFHRIDQTSVGWEELPAAFRNLPNLLHLDLSVHAVHIVKTVHTRTGQRDQDTVLRYLPAIIRSCPLMQHFKLETRSDNTLANGCTQMKIRIALSSLEGWIHLTSIELVGIPILPETVLSKLGNSCPKMQVVKLINVGPTVVCCYQMSLAAAILKWEKLQEFVLSQPQIGPAKSILKSLSQCSSLKKVCIMSVGNSESYDLIDVDYMMTHVKTLYALTLINQHSPLKKSKELTTQLKKRLLNSRPNLWIFISKVTADNYGDMTDVVEKCHLDHQQYLAKLISDLAEYRYINSMR